MGSFRDLTGLKFGKLTAIKRVYIKDKKGTFWECKCECGNTCVVNSGELISNDVSSCGCKKHHLSNSPIYKRWKGMKARCYQVHRKDYKNYGGRGITVCDEWKNNFKAFYDWAISSGFKEDLTLDRIDNNGNYEPSNCRWSTKSEQRINQRPRSEW